MKQAGLDGATQTEALGARIWQSLSGRPGLVVYLEGPLGAGKTTLVRGLLRAAGVRGPIRSPSYTLLEPYAVGNRTLLHVDLYRLNDARELPPLGLSDYPPDRCWWLVEWPERGRGALPQADLRVCLEHAGPRRRARLAGPAAGAVADPQPGAIHS